MTRRRTRSHEQRLAADRRFGIVPGRRFALGVGVLAALVGGSVGVAAADPTVNATVYQPNALPLSETVSTSVLKLSCPTYPGPGVELHGVDGQLESNNPEVDAVPPSWSMASVLGCLEPKIPTTAVSQVIVTNLQGDPELSQPGSVLTDADLLGTGYPCAAQPAEVPFISANGDDVFYYRPWACGDDDNALDSLLPGTPVLKLAVFEGPALVVAARASQTTVSAGATVSFTAMVSGPQQDGLAYDWEINGASASTEQDVALPFSAAGTYDVSVLVTDDAGGGGAATIPITVNATSPAPVSPAPPPNAPAVGPQQSSGTVIGGSAGTPVPGQPVPTSSQTRSEAVTTTAGAKHSQTSVHRTATATTTVAATTTASSTVVTEAIVPSGGSVPGATAPSNGSTGPPSSHVGTSPPPVHRPSRAPARSDLAGTAPTVTGLLISDVTPLPAGASALTPTAKTATAPAVRRAASTSPLAAIAGVLAVVLLFALGIAREWRWRRPTHAQPLSS